MNHDCMCMYIQREGVIHTGAQRVNVARATVQVSFSASGTADKPVGGVAAMNNRRHQRALRGAAATARPVGAHGGVYIPFVRNMAITAISWRCREGAGGRSQTGESLKRFLTIINN